MKKQFILLPLLAALFYVLLSSYSTGPAGTGSLERTGASGSAGCGGAGCHSTSASATTSVTITLLSSGVPVTTYTPGNSYTIQINGTQTSSSFTLPRFGFQVTAAKLVSGVPTTVGTLTAPSGTHITTLSGLKIVEHSSPVSGTGTGGSGTTYSVSVPWTAPVSGTGCITLYGVINSVNFNGVADAGDQWNNTSLVINEAVAAISGVTSACIGATTTLSDPTPCGAWSTTGTVASVGATTGVVTGINPGTATISYTAGTGNTATTTVTIFPTPAAISGTTAACFGLTTTLSNTSGAGSWLSSNTGIATVGAATGVVTGAGTGTATISFTLTATGCKTAIPVTINPLPSAISGTMGLCIAATTILSDATTGGTWASSNTGVATITSSTGIVSGAAQGTSVITYSLPTGCFATAVVTVNPLPATITGTAAVCPSLTTALSDAATGGTWSTANIAIATINIGSGIVTGIAAGTTTITYTLSTGCIAATTLTVNNAPAAISGGSNLCIGTNLPLSDATVGGTWTSGNPPVATAGPTTGIINGASVGIAAITYTEPAAGCIATTSVSVNPLPGTISGTANVCLGNTTTLSNTTSGGSWSSSNTGVATVAAFTGTVTGASAGTTSITYQVGTGCFVTTTLTVDPAPAPISGTTSVCSGTTTTLSDAGGGTWASSNTATATVGVTSGVVTAVGIVGFATITYTLPGTGCKATIPVTVNALPAAITGTATVCAGAVTNLSDATSGGTWSSSNTSVATVTTTGVVTGVITTGGTATITYTNASSCTAVKTITVSATPPAIINPGAICAAGGAAIFSDATTGGTWTSGTTGVITIGATSGLAVSGSAGTSLITYTIAGGCSVATTATVNPAPAAIGGAATVCIGSSLTLTDATTGGTWSSSNTGIATINVSTGVLTSIAIGTTTISYKLPTGCSSSKVITVSPLPSAITGTATICKGLTTTLTDAGGGTWSSGNTAIATAGLTSGVITGFNTGTAAITYTLASGCSAATTVTVSALAPITGTISLCAGLTSTLSDAIIGGTWSSGTTAVATVGATSGLLTSISAGSSVVSYTLPGGCAATAVVNVVSSPGAITGSKIVCLSTTSVLSDAGGGTWSSSNTAIATAAPGTGVITGVALGTATITYSLGTGCVSTTQVTVNTLSTPVTGATALCVGATAALSNATTGGTWSTTSTNASVSASGIVTAVSGGTAIISYTSATGCSATQTVTVNTSPVAISGSLSVCQGLTSALSDVSGGTWVSSNTAVAVIGISTGVTVGISTGTANITYTLAATGCSTVSTVTVNALPSAITGTGVVCVGTSASLTDAGGGSWSSSNTNISVDTVGMISGLHIGTSVITYTLATGCRATTTATVNVGPAAISGGTSAICTGAATTLTDPTPAGNWTSSNAAIAIAGFSSGIVTGIAPGTAVISYIRANGCLASITVTIDPTPAAIGGSAITCTGSVITLTNTISGGSWSSSKPAVATVNAVTGDVTGTTAGTATVTYALPTGCSVTKIITITAPPATVTGPASICAGSSATYTNAVSGGSWSTSNTAIAVAGAGTGTVTGISYGTADITYAISAGCTSITTITIDSLPAAITGAANICSGTSTTLTDAATGGIWSSSRIAVATAGTGSGLVSGISAGTAVITYTLPTGCAATFGLRVDPSPASLTGSAAVCEGLTTKLSDATTGGSWSSSDITIASVTGGVVTGITAGTSVIAYTLASGCLATAVATVNPTPAAITSGGTLCAAASLTLTDASAGGTWTSSRTVIATIIPATGVATGVNAGTTTITYALATGCTTTTVLTVNPLPFAGSISGQSFTCAGSPVTLEDPAGGGTWHSSNPAIATVDASGTVTAVTAGFVTISYSVTNSCGTDNATFTDTIYAAPFAGAITGADSVCLGNTIVISDLVTGGVWSSSDASVASVSGGTITGIKAGSAVISYSVTTFCGTASATLSLTVRSCNVGVNDAPLAAGFRIYPNPSTGVFIIEIPETENGASIVITDMLGKVIDTRSTIGNMHQQVTVDLSRFARGTYLVKINAGAVTYRQKIEQW